MVHTQSCHAHAFDPSYALLQIMYRTEDGTSLAQQALTKHLFVVHMYYTWHEPDTLI